MKDELDALAARLGLTPAQRAELVRFFHQVATKSASADPLSTLALDTFEPVHLISGEEEVSEDASPITERYQQLGHIGQGGMGEVLRVRDVELNRILAMKVIAVDRAGRAAAGPAPHQ